jgi:hypothetical protein
MAHSPAFKTGAWRGYDGRQQHQDHFDVPGAETSTSFFTCFLHPFFKPK